MQNDVKKRMKTVSKWLWLVLLMSICFVVSTTGGAGKAKPILFIPLLISISVYENELVSGCLGAVFGLLIDFASNRTLGLNGAFFLIIGTISSFLFLNLFRKHIFSVILMTTCVTVTYGILDFLFNYVLWGYKSISTVFYHITIPYVIMTIAFSPIIYYIVKKIVDKFSESQGAIIEKRVRNFKI